MASIVDPTETAVASNPATWRHLAESNKCHALLGDPCGEAGRCGGGSLRNLVRFACGVHPTGVRSALEPFPFYARPDLDDDDVSLQPSRPGGTVSDRLGSAVPLPH